MSAPWRPLAIALVLFSATCVAQAPDAGSTGDHVRVVLDTSASMRGYGDRPANDPGRLAVLSVMLLHDLLKPDPNKVPHEDTFAVLPFETRPAPWQGLGAPPPSAASPIRSQGMEPAKRTAFLDSLGRSKLPMDGQSTFYSPSLKRAIDDLPSLSPQDTEVTTRTVVLITDGHSDNPEGDRRYIEDELLPALHEKRARLYVIVFGPDTAAYGEPFFETIARADQANVDSGRYAQRVFPKLFPIRQGEERKLPAAMIELFSDAFGYLHEKPDDLVERIGSGTVRLDPARDLAPVEAAVVALKLDLAGLSDPAPPRETLLPPPGQSAIVQPPLRAVESGASYSMVWLEEPPKGAFTYSIAQGRDESVFVLRPTSLMVYLREHGAATQSCFDPNDARLDPPRYVTMADKECAMDFLVATASGSQGLPPQLKVRYWIKQRMPDGTLRNITDEDGAGIAAGNHKDYPEGRRYFARNVFRSDPSGGKRKFAAEVTVSVDRADKTVAYRDSGNPFHIDVYPLLDIRPDPYEGLVEKPTGGALKGGDLGCTTVPFHLREVGDTRIESALSHTGAGRASDEKLGVQAFLSSPRGGIPPELEGAELGLGDSATGFRGICFPSGGVRKGCEWGAGMQIEPEALVCRDAGCRKLELCVRLAEHAYGDPLSPPEVRVEFILNRPPYNHFRAIQPFAAKVLVAQAPPFDRRTLLPFLMLLLGLLLALLTMRPRLALPKDLGYGLATPASPHRFAFKRLPRAHPLRLLFSPKAGRQVTDGQGALWGWVRPQDDALYGLRPARGVRVGAADGSALEPSRSGIYLLRAHTAYRLDRGDESLLLRIEFA